MPPRISIVIPDLDSPWIDGTLAALRAQELPAGEHEILVVGRDLPGKVPRDGSVRFLEGGREDGTPLNPAAARNRGVASARGELLLFTDADCRPAPGWAVALVAALERVPVAGGAVDFARDADVWALADNIACFHELLADRAAEESSRLPLGSLNLAVRREAWERVGPFDESLPTSEDFDWVLRARAAGLSTAFVPSALVEHAAARTSREALAAHAAWYGRHFNTFRAKHPGVFGGGPTWRHRRLLALTAPLKSVVAALVIFRRHPGAAPGLAGCWRAFPGVVRFKRAWYRAVLASWPRDGGSA
jgi:GT2 family glycosyltransferase